MKFDNVTPLVALLATAGIVTACTADPAGSVSPAAPTAHAVRQSVRNDTIPDSYIVMFKRDSVLTPQATARLIDRLSKRFGGHIKYRYDGVGGYALDSLPANLARLIAQHPAVAYVEPDMVQRMADVQNNPGAGLDRIDQAVLPLDNAFSHTYSGAGVNVYIIDTGIDYYNPEFTGRLGDGGSCVPATDPYSSSDNFGHGTAVASVAAGTTFGVAKNAIIHSVRISWSDDGSTSSSAEICGINYVREIGRRPAVANLSYGGLPSSFAVRDAINDVTYYAQIPFVKAAGNDGVDAFQDRSNRGAYEIVVGATDPTNDTFASFSDYGSTIVTSAPGVNVLVADKFNPGYGKIASGTSFAAPYVAGTVAALLEVNPNLIPSQVVNQLVQWQVTNGVITGLPAGTPNRLLRNAGL